MFYTKLDFESQPFNWMHSLHKCYLNLPDEGKVIWGNAQSPILICRYPREHYQSACGKVRTTFDKNIQVYDQRYCAQANLRKSVSLDDYVLLELKTDEKSECELSNLLSTCPLRPSRHSKYVNGVREGLIVSTSLGQPNHFKNAGDEKRLRCFIRNSHTKPEVGNTLKS